MIEWLDSIWEWILVNKDNLLAFITSTDFVTTMATAVALFKSMKATSLNTLSINSVNNTMKKQQVIESDVVDTKSMVSGVSNEVACIKQEVNNCIERVNKVEQLVIEQDEEIITKLNAMLEVQGIVYATIKDDAIRNSVNSVVIAAKHCDASSKVKLQEELESLRAELKAKNEELDAAVNKVVEKVIADVPVTTEPVKKSSHLRRF